MNLLFNPDGGELGLAEGNTKIETIPFLVMRIAQIFSKLREIKPKDREFVYCVQFSSDYKKTVEAMLMDIEHEGLPEGTAFYEIEGRKIFELRGASGGVRYAMCFYLITKGRLS